MSTMTNEQAGCRCAKVGKTAYYQSKWVEQIDGKEVVEGDVGGDFCPECGRPFNLRPMTLDEAVAYGRPVYEEAMHGGVKVGRWHSPVDEHDRLSCASRYWVDKPTPEQSAAWPWREEEEHE